MLDDWIMALAQPLLPPIEVAAGPEHLKGGFRWEFREQTERALLVGKAVRAARGLRAAWLLCDQGFIEECGTLLRTVSDFTYEIFSISNTLETGVATAAQTRFVRQYFTPMSEDPEQYALEKRERWVTREELLSAHYKTAAESGNADPEQFRKIVRFLSYAYDKFVHGAYITAMELYDGSTRTFMLRGHRYQEKIDQYRFAVASKLHEFLSGLAVFAKAVNMLVLAQVIAVAAKKLCDSGETS